MLPDLESGPDHELSDRRARTVLVSSFLKNRGFVRQHIDSFNHFVSVEMPRIVAANNTIVLDEDPALRLTYLSVTLGPPSIEAHYDASHTVTPHECRLRDLTYAAPLLARVQYTMLSSTGYTTHSPPPLVIGRLPVMLRSSTCVLHGKSAAELVQLQECPLDPGGYFVVKGTEKVLLSQEQLAKNRILVERDGKGDFSVSCTSSSHFSKTKTTFILKSRRLYMRHNSFTRLIPVAVLFRAMGVVSDQEIIGLISDRSAFRPILLATLCDATVTPQSARAPSLQIYTQHDALIWLASQLRWTHGPRDRGAVARMDDVAGLLAHVILCHVPVAEFDFTAKAAFVGLMLRRLLEATEDPSLIDDRDYLGNKRIELAGHVISLMFEDAFKRFNKELKLLADNERRRTARAQPFDFRTLLSRSNRITSAFVSALSSGNLKIESFKVDRAGATQVLSRFSYMAAVGMMSRVNSHFEKTRKVSGPRALQGSQWGMLCPSDTPEGEACGLVKNLALIALVTADAATEDDERLQTLLFDLGVEPLGVALGDELRMEYLILLNGSLIGIHRNPLQFVASFRSLRRCGHVRPFTHVHVAARQRCVYVSSDGGRVCRPLIVVDRQGKPRLTPQLVRSVEAGVRTFEDLSAMGVTEYLDVHEEGDSHIAVRGTDIVPGRTTHMELEPFTLLGAVAGVIPYPHHNQSPRITYQCQMGKQSMGVISMNYQLRIDTVVYALVYPQMPLCTTRTASLVGLDHLPAGMNTMVAVMSFTGYDIEDASIMNRGSMDRGFARCVVSKKYVVALKRSATRASEKVLGPQHVAAGNPRAAASPQLKKLDVDGIVAPGTFVVDGDVLVNRYVPVAEGGGAPGAPGSGAVALRASPVLYKGSVGAYVDKVLVTEFEEDTLLIKLLLRQVRSPELGDKFSSRHGQKGVCGLIVAQADMPFSRAGVVPDLVMNPHGFPSRMTVGKMLEQIASKAAVCDGRRRFGTVFAADPVLETSTDLLRCGLSYGGKELMTSGTSGEPMPGFVFFGPIYYQKLKHMVQDKIHARARGRVSALTRQPLEGRSRGGGLRVGEMERDCLVAYGATLLVTERLMLASDAYSAAVCGACGLVGYRTHHGCTCRSCTAGHTHGCTATPCPQCPPAWCPSCRGGRDMHTVTMPYACKLLLQEMTAMGVVPRLRVAR
eukprot:TRINITY_DN8444_c0_g1_i1.p1 TRINITY_DN8444_c0_g1~~TRINITY_DN8444_c0_g1_i1.p1  ORF type:complete len:1174 (+),score=284.30 TRINITY_DN8444_c0_g1_i1:192-3713(+)